MFNKPLDSLRRDLDNADRENEYLSKRVVALEKKLKVLLDHFSLEFEYNPQV